MKNIRVKHLFHIIKFIMWLVLSSAGVLGFLKCYKSIHIYNIIYPIYNINIFILIYVLILGLLLLYNIISSIKNKWYKIKDNMEFFFFMVVPKLVILYYIIWFLIMICVIITWFLNYAVQVVDAAGGGDIVWKCFTSSAGFGVRPCIICYKIKVVHAMLTEPVVRNYFNIPPNVNMGNKEHLEFAQLFNRVALKHQNMGLIKLHGTDFHSFGYEWVNKEGTNIIKAYKKQMPFMPDVVEFTFTDNVVEVLQRTQCKMYQGFELRESKLKEWYLKNKYSSNLLELGFTQDQVWFLSKHMIENYYTKCIETNLNKFGIEIIDFSPMFQCSDIDYDDLDQITNTKEYKVALAQFKNTDEYKVGLDQFTRKIEYEKLQLKSLNLTDAELRLIIIRNCIEYNRERWISDPEFMFKYHQYAYFLKSHPEYQEYQANFYYALKNQPINPKYHPIPQDIKATSIIIPDYIQNQAKGALNLKPWDMQQLHAARLQGLVETECPKTNTLQE